MFNILARSARRPFVLLSFALVIGVAGCESSCDGGAQKHDNTAGNEDPAKTVAAVVNNSEVSLTKLNELHSRAVSQMNRTGRKTTADIEKKMRSGILRNLIDDAIIQQQAKEKGIQVDRFERVEALEQYKARVGGPKAFEVLLREQGFSEEQMLETIIADKIRDKVIEKASGKIDVTEEEVKSHYEANKRLYTLPEMVKARHILLKLTKDDPVEKAQLVLKKADQILAEAKDAKNSFETLVQKYSDGPSAKNNGDLGFFARGRMVKSFEDAAFNAPLKTPVGPIQTDFGYHIIYVEEKSPAKEAPLETVKDRIMEFMKRNKRSIEGEKMLVSLRKSADIKIYDYSMTQEDYARMLDPEKLARKKPAE